MESLFQTLPHCEFGTILIDYPYPFCCFLPFLPSPFTRIIKNAVCGAERNAFVESVGDDEPWVCIMRL